MNVNRWVDDRLAALDDGGEWQPEASVARARLRDLDRRARIKRRWAWATAAAACLGLLTFIQPRACAMPRGCFQSATENPAPRPVEAAPVTDSVASARAAVSAQTAKPQKVAPTVAPAVAPTVVPTVVPTTETRAVRNYKESGLAGAPIACEVYSDYECPSCAAFFRDTMPLLVAEYVQTGKVKLLHRDFPLPQHRYAKLAARYANAAGQAGQYDVAVTQLFRAQDIWSVSGDIEAQLAPVLPPAVMRKVHDMVEHDQRLDETVTADLAMGVSDRLRATPTLVVVWKGNRQAISPIPSYALLKSYLDELLGRQ
jgi:protein-disulfide isomerase